MQNKSYMGHTSKWKIHTGDDHFLTAFSYLVVYIWTFKNLIEPLNYSAVSLYGIVPLLDHSTAIENICGATCISGANYFKA